MIGTHTTTRKNTRHLLLKRRRLGGVVASTDTAINLAAVLRSPRGRFATVAIPLPLPSRCATTLRRSSNDAAVGFRYASVTAKRAPAFTCAALAWLSAGLLPETALTLGGVAAGSSTAPRPVAGSQMRRPRQRSVTYALSVGSQNSTAWSTDSGAGDDRRDVARSGRREAGVGRSDRATTGAVISSWL